MKKIQNLLKKGNDEDFMLPKMLDPDDIEKHYIWVTEFDDANLKTFYNSFMRLERDPAIEVVPIIISSYGGYCDVLSAMRDLIKSSPKPVATIATGKAMSCGVALTASGTKGMRFASEGARIMIHEISTGSWGKNADFQVTAEESKRLNKVFMSNLAEDMGKSYDWIMAELHKRKTRTGSSLRRRPSPSGSLTTSASLGSTIRCPRRSCTCRTRTTSSWLNRTRSWRRWASRLRSGSALISGT